MTGLTYSNPNAFGKEGVDHINMSNQSTTQLGLVLDLSYLKVVDYPHIGKFASVSNLWYWLKSSPLDDSLRRAKGIRLKSLAASINTRGKVANFKSIIGMATYAKLKDYPHCMKQLKTLPEDVQIISYYVPKGTGIRMCSNYIVVVNDVVELIRRAVIKGVEPDFSELADDIHGCGYSFLKPFLLENFGEEGLLEFEC